MKQCLIGAHTSTIGGVHQALLEAQSIGASTCQFFTSNHRRWNQKPISDEALRVWNATLEETGMQSIMSHSSFLINLGSPHAHALQKSREAFVQELERCQRLGITFLNFHPGAALDSSTDACIETICSSLKGLEALASQGTTRLLIETTAGQGSCIGHSFEQIGAIISEVEGFLPIGVCIDTCHIFAAGYPIRTLSEWQKTLDLFDKEIGLKHLFALHVNDSLKPFGSRRYRHAPLGEGEIGIPCFQAMMTEPRLQSLPKYLETPGGPPRWKQEIALLRSFESPT